MTSATMRQLQRALSRQVDLGIVLLEAPPDDQRRALEILRTNTWHLLGLLLHAEEEVQHEGA